MKTRKTFIAAAIVAVLSCSAAHAQVLGGAVGGAVNGAVGGGLRDTSVFGNGNATGSFGGELDTGSMIERTRGAADQTTRRARNVGANVRNRTESTVATAHDTSANVASSAAAAAHAAKDEQTAQHDGCRRRDGFATGRDEPLDCDRRCGEPQLCHRADYRAAAEPEGAGLGAEVRQRHG